MTADTTTAPHTAESAMRVSLNKAHDRVLLARAERERAGIELEHHQRIAEGHRQKATEAAQAVLTSAIEDAPGAQQRAMDASVMAGAATRKAVDAKKHYDQRHGVTKSAEENLQATIAALLGFENDQLAQQILDLEHEAVRLRERLIGQIPDPLHTPINRLHEVQAMSTTVTRALDPPPMMSTSRYRAMSMEAGPHRARIDRWRREWAERRAELERPPGPVIAP